MADPIGPCMCTQGPDNDLAGRRSFTIAQKEPLGGKYVITTHKHVMAHEDSDSEYYFI